MFNWLVADVGGTNTRIALANPEGLDVNSIRSFSNSGFTDFGELIFTYLGELPSKPHLDAICAGVAGPVRNSTAQLTNHSWFIDAKQLGATVGVAHVHLLNDLQAQGFALDDLAAGSVSTLFSGVPSSSGPRLVLGLGTGCNIAVAHQIRNFLFVPAAEAGHSRLPHMEKLSGLMGHLELSHPHLPIEAALSGPGLSNIHEWVTGVRLSPPEVVATENQETLRHFISLLGQVAGDLCLSHMATGGLYFIGSAARAIAPYLEQKGFIESFGDKGPYSELIRDIPVYLIEDDTSALSGCVQFLKQALR